MDKVSGAKAPGPKLDLVVQLLREGDTFAQRDHSTHRFEKSAHAQAAQPVPIKPGFQGPGR
jgi:hypothetical protein